MPKQGGMPTTIESKLDRSRKALLDLTARNRLLNTPRHKARSKSLEIVDERSDEVFRILVTEQRPMSFVPLPGRETDPNQAEEEADQDWLPQPDDNGEVDDRGVAERHTDTRLQTRLVDKALQKRLLGLFHDARTAEEEQGVNILYVALGFLKWYEDDASDIVRYAPLVLVPCELTRRDAGGRILLRARQEDITTNLSLHARLRADHGIEIPEMPDVEDLVPTAYCEELRRAVAGRPRWEVLPDDIVLSFFSFSKFLMYRDLKPDVWDRGAGDMPPVLDGLLGRGFAPEDSPWPDGDRIDDHVGPEDMVHVMDADSSQIEVIEEAKRGRNLVIQGPPGTGKSQTIANLIATAVMQGKRVLFVAEKLAALDVVHARLDKLGLGAMCLQLHSRKANKKQVLAQLESTLALGKPRLADLEEVVRRLRDSTSALNRHADTLHTVMEPAAITPYQVLGEVVRHLHRGTPLPDLEIPNALSWSEVEFKKRRERVSALCLRLQTDGAPATHAWRGACVPAVLPTDLTRLEPRVDAAAALLDAVQQKSAILTVRLGLAPPVTIADAQHLARMANVLKVAPDFDRPACADRAWKAPRRDLRQLVALGQQYAARAAKVEGVFRPEAWEWSPTATRERLQADGRKLLRFLRSDYRRAKVEFLRMASHPPRTLDQRIDALENLERARGLASQISTYQTVGAATFGRLWDGLKTDWSRLDSVLDWVQSAEAMYADIDFPALLPKLDDPMALARDCEIVGQTAAQLSTMMQGLVDAVQLDLQVAFGQERVLNVPLANLASRVREWRHGLQRLMDWIPIARGLVELRQLGLVDLADRLFSGTAHAGTAAAQFELAYYEAWMREAMRRHPHLALFEGRSHAEIVADFKKLDTDRIRLAQAEVALAHWHRIPKGSGSVGELAVVMREIKKKKRHIAVRRLLDEAGSAIQGIKPVFMMSPLSIAQFLSPRRVEFDLLLIDEASQVQPVDAFGALLRSRQAVVVGDEKQLPPTNFFAHMAGGDEEDEEVESVGDLESILGLCSAQGMCAKMLRWHYRSQHQSLIAVSNRQFYSDGLYVVPSPFATSDELGLKFRPVAGGVFDRGGSTCNRIEATRVARAVIEHARTRPNESLGVGTFSVAQKDAILDELERLWRTESDVRGFFAPTRPDPFFVKNLESIQGDERDVIFVSVGYGKDQNGYFGMNFGPLSRDGGERRLNVLITRARKRCEVFSSIRASEIDLNRASSRGAAALREFLAYAETGAFSIGVPSGRGFDSPFEEEVARELGLLGHDIVSQVGIAGFFVDLAVVDPSERGRYLLGIECDGAAYHSSRSARDRDRLRQQVLENRGWTIHRIWSTDWFKDREAQKRRVVAAIEQAKELRASAQPNVVLEPRPDYGQSSGSGTQVRTIEREAADESMTDASAGFAVLVPYECADFPVEVAGQLHEVPFQTLVPLLRRIIDVEGPIHRNEIARRLTTLWGLHRAGSRIQGQVDGALGFALAAGELLESHPDFFDPVGERPIRVRDRSAGTVSLKTVEMLPPSEIQWAIRHFVQQNVGIDRVELARLVARAVGFKATSADMVDLVHKQLESLLSHGLVERDGKVFEESPAHQARSRDRA